MNIIIVSLIDLNQVPPVRNLMDCLLNNGHKVAIITIDDEGALEEYKMKGVETYKIHLVNNKNKVKAFVDFKNRRNYIRNTVKKLLNRYDVVWTTHDRAAVEVGYDILSKTHHIMEILELVKDIPEFPSQSLVMAHLEKYAQKADAVVMPEYNRAMISKLWWDLEKTPYILPNKPYRIVDKDVPKSVQEKLFPLMNEGKKVLLYQGIFYKDRNLDVIADAIKSFDDFSMYIMGVDNEVRKKFNERHPEVKYISYIKPPYHMIAAEYSYIGLLPYKAVKGDGHFSELNALYCAPNKIYEYAVRNLPMLGSDVPGLRFPFSIYNIGRCYEDNVNSIQKAIRDIDQNYEEMSSNCMRFFDHTDLDEIISSILSNIQ